MGQDIIRSISSVGLERFLDREEVIGSNPIWITKPAKARDTTPAFVYYYSTVYCDMSYYSPTIRAHRLFREQCDQRTEQGLYDQEMKTALGSVVIKCSDFFTADVQPIYTNDGLAYAITQYGSDEVIVVRDDDYPDMELPEWCSSELLPLGFRKAAALSEILHAENINRFDIGEDVDEKKYRPKEPYYAYLKSTGQNIPLDELALKYFRLIVDNKIFQLILESFGYVLLCAIGGVFLAISHDGDVHGYMCGGALFGIAYFLINLFYNHAISKK